MDKKETAAINKAIQYWEEKGIVDENTATRLRTSHPPADNDSGILSAYALVACVSCGLLAFGALVMDEKWIELIRRRLGFSELIVGIAFLLLTLLFTWQSYRRIRKMKYSIAGNEAFNITIVLSLAVALAYTGRSIGYENGHYAPVLLTAALLYGAIACLLRSTLLWAVMLTGLAGWWGAQTYYWSGGGDYFLGMNYALRMTIFGLAVLSLWLLVRSITYLKQFETITYIMGWVFFLVAAWSLSVLGNSSSIDVWMQVKQGKLWYWALAFTLLLLGIIVYAFRRKDTFLRDTGLIFFLLNIYTRYFEYFWDKTNKGLFFAILAVSFWGLGRAAERWRRKQPESNSGN